jgi:hypothetical protein
MIESFLLVQTGFFTCNNSERKNFSHPFSALQSLKIRLVLKLFSFFPQYEPEKGFLKDSNSQMKWKSYFATLWFHICICSTYSSCQKGTTWLHNDTNAVHSETMGVYNLAEKGHQITNYANSVHSESVGVYNLAKKWHHITKGQKKLWRQLPL